MEHVVSSPEHCPDNIALDSCCSGDGTAKAGRSCTIRRACTSKRAGFDC